MYISPYFDPFSCQMVVMKGLTYHMVGIAINYIIRLYFTPEVYKLYQCAMPFTAESKILFLIIQILLFLEINILAKTQLLYCVT